MKVKNYANKLKIKTYVNKLKMELNGCYRMTVNSKAFAIPILTEFAFIMIDTIAVKIRKANALELTFIL